MSNREHTLSYCTECANRKFDFKRGIVCGLIQDIPSFEKDCSDFIEDQNVIQTKIAIQERQKQAQLEPDAIEKSFGLHKLGITNSIIAGSVMIIVSIFWYTAGSIVGIIYFYPPILFLSGIYILFRGLQRQKLINRSKRKDRSSIDS
ncbi:MAG: hypothetical protein CMP67_11095 [Flavobacteriales bacterium]|nr:hypothetical protein [Flavobacteriales bacterium]MBO72111.1 hypothetical protein [Flavobacteriales bacterium]|tara:strand:- start:100 stop:540 length:441 start_codon:yes stop_codon:yes gene_type:complete